MNLYHEIMTRVFSILAFSILATPKAESSSVYENLAIYDYGKRVG